ncbi:MAG: 4'-phosphopantetheinyl transferase superfamily protein [Verrucomicrobiota bacterium]|jgi:4'-phosphopantetheinyl transferase
MGDSGHFRVHLWSLSLSLPPAALAQAASLLAPREAERAARFRFEGGRHRAIAGRGQLRAVLGRCLGADPAALEFSYGPQGKPALAGVWSGSGWHFNLAHSADVAVLAVTRSGPVGVDVERIRPLTDVGRLVSRFFSPREDAAFRALPEDQKADAFFRLWTRKEAWLKATGEGITQSLARVEVSFLPGEPARLLSLPQGPAALCRWRLHDLDCAPGFVAALAVVADAGPMHPEPPGVFSP